MIGSVANLKVLVHTPAAMQLGRAILGEEERGATCAV